MPNIDQKLRHELKKFIQEAAFTPGKNFGEKYFM